MICVIYMHKVHRSMQLKNVTIVLNYKENEFQMSLLYTYKCHCYVTVNVPVFTFHWIDL